jgi:hypothetical protein
MFAIGGAFSESREEDVAVRSCGMGEGEWRRVCEPGRLRQVFQQFGPLDGGGVVHVDLLEQLDQLVVD